MVLSTVKIGPTQLDKIKNLHLEVHSSGVIGMRPAPPEG